MSKRIVITINRVPFAYGGAEMLVESLRDQLVLRGHEVDVVAVPFAWSSRTQLLKSALSWRLLDLTSAGGQRIDLVIATRFPSYVVKHPNKVVWLIHQMRQVYDLLGTPYSDFREDEPRDRQVIDGIRAMDRRTLSEARAVYTISGNVAERLKRFNEVEGTPLYPPPRLEGRYHEGDFGDYVFTAGRLDRLKRFDLLIRALEHTQAPVRCRIAGEGPERGKLEELIARLRLGDRVELLGWASDDAMVEHYAGSLAVFYAPYDEDYGYVTVEAFKSGKPVVTAADSGGVLEFVEEGRNGFICPPDAPREIAARLDTLYKDRERARKMGQVGMETVAGIGWDAVIRGLVGE
ncbi:MAG TPA: glycosyltransferase family 4 protein [Thermoanaerobaculia bacterium]|nr:glycosyltransferase family 4 protein [Thermoanaerobaculia bacterium]